MNIQSGLSGHWTDEQLIDFLYEAGPQNDHVVHCPECESRLSLLRQNRSAIEKAAGAAEPSSDFLAAQRRRIYARLEEEQGQVHGLVGRVPRWASAMALILALGGALFVAEDGSRLGLYSNSGAEKKAAAISDSQLAAEVSQLAESPEPVSTQPLQALFAE